MEVIINVKGSKASHEAPVKSDSISSHKRVSLNRLPGGLLHYNGPDGKPSVKFGRSLGNSTKSLELLVNKNPGARNSMELETLARKGDVKERRRSSHNNKAAKPPRPPNGPTLDAADICFINEITRTAMMKKERAKHIKNTQQSAKISSSSALLSFPRRSTMLTSIITFLCLLMLIILQVCTLFQFLLGLACSGTNTSSNPIFAAAPQAAQEPAGLLSPVIRYDQENIGVRGTKT